MKQLTPIVILACSFIAVGCHDSCFTAGTLIDTPKGQVPIESITPGQEVYGYDLATRTKTVERVQRVFVHHDADVRTMLLDDGNTLNVTAEHPFYDAKTRAYRPASEFQAGASLSMFVSSGLSSVGLSQWTKERTAATVYNFEVSGHHNYFANGLLVHNKTPLPPEAGFPDASVDSSSGDGGTDN